MVVGVNDTLKVKGKPMVYIDVPFVRFKGGKALSARPSVPGVSDEDGYGAFFPNSPVPVISPLHLKYFAKKLSSSYEILVKRTRWSKAKYPLIEQTLPIAIETAFKLGAKYVGDPDEPYPENKDQIMVQNIEDYTLNKKFFKDMEIGELKYRAKALNLEYTKSVKKPVLIALLTNATDLDYVE